MMLSIGVIWLLKRLVIRLVNLVIQRAEELRVSDIYIEPLEYRLKVRYRVEGVLEEGKVCL